MRTSSVFLRTPVRREAVEIALSSMLRVVRMHRFFQYCMHPSSDAVRSEEKPGKRNRDGSGFCETDGNSFSIHFFVFG
jgi:hypothetical protein